MASPVMMPIKPKPMPMSLELPAAPAAHKWEPGVCLSLAREGCTHCDGLGMSNRRGYTNQPCNCVLRKVFRVCFGKYRVIQMDASMSQARMERIGLSNESRFVFGRKQEEFAADFFLISQRVLKTLPLQWAIFRAHWLQGQDWKACSKRFGMDRGTFFHEVYRIQSRLGRAFCEVKPYAIYPLGEYFGGVIGRDGEVKNSQQVGKHVLAKRIHRLLPPMKLKPVIQMPGKPDMQLPEAA